MRVYPWYQLSERAKERAISLYYADSAYQNFIEEKAKELPEEVMTVEDWAIEKGVMFTEHGERIA